MRYLYGRDGKALSGTAESALSVSAIDRQIGKLLDGFDRNAWLAGADSGIEDEDELRATILRFEVAALELRQTIAGRLGPSEETESETQPLTTG